tara:strand:- start:440 stop:736 length:297 start_codon:yes stop_codon:yes gene_type:complete
MKLIIERIKTNKVVLILSTMILFAIVYGLVSDNNWGGTNSFSNNEGRDITLTDYTINKLYFSITTGCLLGYGDIYPITSFLKSIVSLQVLITIIIIAL